MVRFSDEIITETENIFLIFFLRFRNLDSILNIVKKKRTLLADVFLNRRTPKNMVRKTSKKSRFRGPFDK